MNRCRGWIRTTVPEAMTLVRYQLRHPAMCALHPRGQAHMDKSIFKQEAEADSNRHNGCSVAAICFIRFFGIMYKQKINSERYYQWIFLRSSCVLHALRNGEGVWPDRTVSVALLRHLPRLFFAVVVWWRGLPIRC